MYADRHARSSAIDPRSLGIAIALNGAVIAALLFAQPVFTVITHDKPFHTYAVPPVEPPPPLPTEPTAQHPTRRQTLVIPHTVVERHEETSPLAGQIDLPPLPPVGNDGPATGPTATPSPIPVTIAPEIDPAHRGDLQPTYPAAELRAEREGVVVVRVLIGPDGRVHEVEQVSATSAAFLAATRERALARWRFRPATRGGVAVEAWRTMTIRFVIPR